MYDTFNIAPELAEILNLPDPSVWVAVFVPTIDTEAPLIGVPSDEVTKPLTSRVCANDMLVTQATANIVLSNFCFIRFCFCLVIVSVVYNDLFRIMNWYYANIIKIKTN